MNDASWWARVVQARTERDDLRPKRVWALRKEGREAAIDLTEYPGSARSRARRGRGAAQDAAVPVARTGGTVGAIAACDDVRG
jgi:hypothetical protein